MKFWSILLALLVVGIAAEIGLVLGVCYDVAQTMTMAEITAHLAYPGPYAQKSPVIIPEETDKILSAEVPADQPQDSAASSEAPSAGETYTATAYCLCQVCCGIWSAEHPSRQGTDYVQLTATGTVPTVGRTAGADWSVLPPGTVIEIEGIGQRVIEDKGAAWVSEQYGGKYIDLFVADHEAALEFGRQELNVKAVSK